MQTIVIEMTEQKFMEFLLRGAVKVIKAQEEEIEKLKLERKIQATVINGLEENERTLRETMREFIQSNVELSEELVENQEATDTLDRVNGAFLAVLRGRLRDGAPVTEVIAKINEFLDA